MDGHPWDQSAYDVRFEWGATGVARLATRPDQVVVVDVLSFTTSVTVAVGRGTAVYPCAWDDAQASALAQRVGAELAVGRRRTTAGHPWSLSPAAIARAPAPERLVLPSPNGSAVAAAAGDRVVAACLRNASAVGAWLVTHAETVTVVAAGERWPDGSLRPAVEDLLGAGAVLAAVAADGAARGLRLSPEAEAVAGAYCAAVDPADLVRRSGSGVELVRAGFADDVETAVQVDVSTTVPVLAGGAFRSG